MEKEKVFVISYYYEMYSGALGDNRFVARDMETAKKIFEDIKQNIILPLLDGYDDEDMNENLDENDTLFKFFNGDDYAEIKIEEKEVL